jgi:hypothetical protein
MRVMFVFLNSIFRITGRKIAGRKQLERTVRTGQPWPDSHKGKDSWEGEPRKTPMAGHPGQDRSGLAVQPGQDGQNMEGIDQAGQNNLKVCQR